MTWNALWPTLFWLWIASELLLTLITRTRPSQGKLQDRGSQLLLISVIWGSIVLEEWISNRFLSASFSGSPWLKPLTVALLLLGLAIRWSAIVKLGRSFSVNVAIHPTQTVQRNGLYRFVRHPSYTGLFLILFAVALRSRNWVSSTVILVSFTAALLYRIRVEEQALHKAFGPAYADYARTTRRLIPGIY